MANHTNLNDLFTGIADAIREKTGSTDELVADNFPQAIADIPAGANIEGEEVQYWSQNVIEKGMPVVMDLNETLVASSLQTKTLYNSTTPTLYSFSNRSISPDGKASWNLTGYSTTYMRIERLGDDGSFKYLNTVKRASTVSYERTTSCEVLALSATNALVFDNSSTFYVYKFNGSSISLAASASNTSQPFSSRMFWMPGADGNSFFYLSSNRVLVKGTISGSSITFTNVDSTTYKNKVEIKEPGSENGYSQMYGALMPNGEMVVSWHKVLTSMTGTDSDEDGEEWIYEKHTYDVYLSVLNSNGSLKYSKTLCSTMTGWDGYTIAGLIRAPIQLSDGKVLIFVNLTENGGGDGEVYIITLGDSTWTKSANLLPYFRSKYSYTGTGWAYKYEVVSRKGDTTVLAYVDSFGRHSDGDNYNAYVIAPEITFYALVGYTLTEEYTSSCPFAAAYQSYGTQKNINGLFTVAGDFISFTVYINSSWTPGTTYVDHLLAKWTSGYSTSDKPGKAYIGVCGKSSDENGNFTVITGGDLISFEIEGVTCWATPGMTWSEWVASSYNTLGLVEVKGNTSQCIWWKSNSNGRVSVAVGSTTVVLASEKIVAFNNYGFTD